MRSLVAVVNGLLSIDDPYRTAACAVEWTLSPKIRDINQLVSNLY